MRKRNKSFRISIPIYILYCFVGLILISLIIGTVSFLSYNQRLIEQKRTKTLARENRLLSDKLTKIENQLTRFKQTIIELSEFDSKLRLSFAMDLIPQDVRLMGVGGLNHEAIMDAGQADMIQTENTLAELERQAQFQKQSFAEIVTYIQQQDKVLSHTPSIWPVRGWVSSGYGYRNDPFTGRRVMHRGLDIVAPSGTPIVAAADGRVNLAGLKRGYGKTVQIDHGYGYTTFYGHCQSIRVRYGQVVRRGQVIATVGRTGKTTGYHLHYGVKVSGTWVNPRNYILDNYAVVE